MVLDVIFLVVVVVGVVAAVAFFRQRQNDSWKKLASDLGGEFVAGGFFRSGKIRVSAGTSLITIDTYSVPSGDSSTTYTRLCAPFQTPDGWQFNIQRKGWVGRLDKKLGLQHIDIGDEAFDHDFLVQSNNEMKVRSMLMDSGLRSRVQSQKSLQLFTKNNELRLEVQGVINDLTRLKALYALFGEVLQKVAG